MLPQAVVQRHIRHDRRGAEEALAVGAVGQHLAAGQDGSRLRQLFA